MIKGINYDTGFVHAGVSTHEPFDVAAVAADMTVIAGTLHCDAVRISGGDPDRLESTARCAAAAGLQVWWTPFPCDVTPGEAHTMIVDCARRAEHVRREGADIVFLAGAELGLFVHGLLPGATFPERAALLTGTGPARAEALTALPARLDALLRDLVRDVREVFSGPVGYCSLPFEQVDWSVFDWFCTDAGYRSTEDDDTYRAGLRSLAAHGRPVAVTEFGAATHAGAARRGGHGSDIVEYRGPVPIRLTGDHRRDEQEQADRVRECLESLDAAGVDAAFLYTFATFHLPRRDGARADLDLASAGIVAVLDPPAPDHPVPPDQPLPPGERWIPKIAFTTFAAFTPAPAARRGRRRPGPRA